MNVVQENRRRGIPENVIVLRWPSLRKRRRWARLGWLQCFWASQEDTNENENGFGLPIMSDRAATRSRIQPPTPNPWFLRRADASPCDQNRLTPLIPNFTVPVLLDLHVMFILGKKIYIFMILKNKQPIFLKQTYIYSNPTLLFFFYSSAFQKLSHPTLK